MITAWLVVAAPLLPLVLAALSPATIIRRRFGALLPWAPLPAVLVALLPAATVEMPWLLLGAKWGLGGVARIFLLFTALLWIAAGIYARGYIPRDGGYHRFNLFWLLTLTGNLGLILAVDIASFYTFFALMTFSAYGLVVHSGSREALRAGRVYITMAILGEVMLLAGLVLAVTDAAEPLLPLLAGAIAGSDHRDLTIALLWTGFGVKAGLPLLHMWLALAHPAAPVPASAVLSGAMIKAGLLGWLVTLPVGELALPGWGLTVMAWGLTAAFGAALVGVCQGRAKTVLAYSSISQMGLMTTLLGAALAQPSLAPALVSAIAFYAFHHAFAKGALFLGVGIAHHAGGIPGPMLWTGLALPGLALAGVPLTSGAAAKLQAKSALYGGEGALLSQLPLLMTLAAVGTTLLVARFLWCLYREMGDEKGSPGTLVGWLATLLFSLAGVFWLLPGVAIKSLSGLGDAVDLLWPAALGGLAAWLALRRLRWVPAIPEGDILSLLAPVAPLWRRAKGRLVALLDRGRSLSQGWRRLAGAIVTRGGALHGEVVLRSGALLLFVAVLLVLTLLLMAP